MSIKTLPHILLFGLLLFATQPVATMQKLNIHAAPLINLQKKHTIGRMFAPIKNLSLNKKLLLAGGASTAALTWWHRDYLTQNISLTTSSLNKSDYFTLLGITSTAIAGGILTKKPNESIRRAALYSFGIFLLEFPPILLTSNTTFKKILYSLTARYEHITPLKKDAYAEMSATLTEEQKLISNLRIDPITEQEKAELETKKDEEVKAAKKCDPNDKENYNNLEARTEKAYTTKKDAEKSLKLYKGELLLIEKKIEITKQENPIDAQLEKLIKNKEKLENEIKKTEDKIEENNKIIAENESSLANLLNNKPKIKTLDEKRCAVREQQETLNTFPKLLGIFGKPGLGKTEIINYLARQWKSEASFYKLPTDPLRFPHFHNYILTESRVKDRHIFVLVDEFESIAAERQNSTNAEREKSSLFLSEILPILNEKTDKIHLIAIGNHYSLIDDASKSRFFEHGLKSSKQLPVLFFDSAAMAYKKALEEIEKIATSKGVNVNEKIKEIIEKIVLIPNISWREIGNCISIIKKEADTNSAAFISLLETQCDNILKEKAVSSIQLAKEEKSFKEELEKLQKSTKNNTEQIEKLKGAL